MKQSLAFLGGVCAVALIACGSAQKPEPATGTSSAALSSSSSEANADSDKPQKTAAEEWAEKKVAAEVAASKGKETKSTDASASDPLSMNSDLEESSIPKVDITPKNQVRGKSAGELNAAMSVVKSASSVDEAAKKLTQRLGKPNWVESPKSQESAKRRIWVAPGQGSSCQRLVLEADGSVEFETASKTDWRMLAASARQNPCTGEIKRGINH